MKTPFTKIYDSFFSKVTDDMYMELTEQDTYKMVQPLLIAAIHHFEFPRVDLNNYTLSDNSTFEEELSDEEVNILSTYMVVEWIGQQVASIEVTRQKYSGSDFKFTSQAQHLSKLITLREHYKTEGYHLQRLYGRRKKDKNGIMRSTFGSIMSDD